MIRSLLAFVTMTLVACSGSTGSDHSPDQGDGPTDDTNETGITVDPTMARVHYTAVVNGNPTDCLVNRRELDEETYETLGLTDVTLNVEPGAAVYALGDPERMMLDRQPVHSEPNDSRWLFKEELAPEVGGPLLGGDVELVPAPRYVCSYKQCEYIDAGERTTPTECNGTERFDEPQGIFMDPQGYLTGDQNQSFGGQGSGFDRWRQDGDRLVYEPGDPNNYAMEAQMGPDLSFSYYLLNDLLKEAYLISCHLE